jgi:hypothetical protein
MSSRTGLRPLIPLVLGLLGGAATGCDDENTAHPEPTQEGGGGGASSGSGGKSVLPEGGTGATSEGGEPAASGGEAGAAPVIVAPSLYAMSAIAFGDEGTATYLSLLESLDIEQTDFSEARELAGQADIWVHEGALYVAEADALTITKFTLEDGALVEGDQISFANYGLTDFGFWVNVFVAPDKAYLQNGTAEYIIWDPAAMAISGTLPLPELAERDGLRPFLGYADRSAPVRDGLVYQSVYYTNADYFEYDPGSSLLVIDTENDQVVDTIDVPCPGIDFSSRDEDDNLYFSSWVFAPGGAAVLEQPTTCVAKLAAGEDTPTKLFDLPDVTEGRQGGVLRYLGDGKAVLSVLHDDNSSATAVAEITYGPNWRFWLYDLNEGTAELIEGLDWNAGAAYSASLTSTSHMLVPAGDYASTQVFAIATDGSVTPLVKSLGWSLRLFGLP